MKGGFFIVFCAEKCYLCKLLSNALGIFQNGVKKTNLNFFQKLGRAITGKSKVDDDVLDALEEALPSSDMGVDTTLKLI